MHSDQTSVPIKKHIICMWNRDSLSLQFHNLESLHSQISHFNTFLFFSDRDFKISIFPYVFNSFGHLDVEGIVIAFNLHILRQKLDKLDKKKIIIHP